MRIAFTPDEFIQQLYSAKSEALKSFNNDEMLVEKFVQKPRLVNSTGPKVFTWDLSGFKIQYKYETRY